MLVRKKNLYRKNWQNSGTFLLFFIKYSLNSSRKQKKSFSKIIIISRHTGRFLQLIDIPIWIKILKSFLPKKYTWKLKRTALKLAIMHVKRIWGLFWIFLSCFQYLKTKLDFKFCQFVCNKSWKWRKISNFGYLLHLNTLFKKNH